MKPPLQASKNPLPAQPPWPLKQDGDGHPPRQELSRQPGEEDEDDDAKLLDPLASTAGQEEEVDMPTTTRPTSPATMAGRGRIQSFTSEAGCWVLDPLLRATSGGSAHQLTLATGALEQEEPPPARSRSRPAIWT
jgi:hypothetical protein